jgi:hypothetical protein
MPPMPPTDSRQPYDQECLPGYDESLLDWFTRNEEGVEWFLENAETIRFLLSTHPSPFANNPNAPTPGTPVPPINPEIITRLRELSLAVTEERWSEFSMSVPVRRNRDADLVLADAADWIAQAIPEREKLAELLVELAKYLEIPDMQLGIIPSKNRKLADRARATAERLRGGGGDG